MLILWACSAVAFSNPASLHRSWCNSGSKTLSLVEHSFGYTLQSTKPKPNDGSFLELVARKGDILESTKEQFVSGLDDFHFRTRDRVHTTVTVERMDKILHSIDRYEASYRERLGLVDVGGRTMHSHTAHKRRNEAQLLLHRLVDVAIVFGWMFVLWRDVALATTANVIA
jgi:hypothetical protein